MEVTGSPEWMPKPELYRNRPDLIFTYARDKQKWLRERVSTARLPNAMDGLVEELENYTSATFGVLPELLIVSRDVHHTVHVGGEGSSVLIESGPLPLEGDAALYDEHTIRRYLYGFHQGEEHDLRVYVSTPEDPVQMMGGVYIPLISISVENSEIRFAESIIADRITELVTYITEQLDNYSPEINQLVRNLIRQLKDNETSPVKQLQSSSFLIAGISRLNEVSVPFLDAILEAIKLKLNLDTPHDIKTSAYREVITERPTASYKARPGKSFFGIMPELGLIGETGNKGIGLFFLEEDTAIQIPVQYITGLYKSVNI
jgi:hypothetical protein